MTGRLFLILGPSGAGKDTVIAGLAERLSPEDGVLIARRVITRPLHPASAERHVPVTSDGFARLRAAGAFALDWASHGLLYGIGAEVRAWLAAGLSVVANGSRATLPDARSAFGPALVATEIRASPATLAARLAARGREDAAQIAARLDRTAVLPPVSVDLVIDNDGPPDVAVAALLAAIRHRATTCV